MLLHFLSLHGGALLGLALSLLIIAACVVGVVRRRDVFSALALFGMLVSFASHLTGVVIMWDLEDWVSNGPHPGKQQIMVLGFWAGLAGQVIFGVGFVLMMATLGRRPG